ncbi:hypothetical protein D0867_01560 [Hortaea werneckii]|uniref:Uncharacterized protein n=2 Tax=Hortaea werneckii TaxID=91943 RepID=A0A3M7BAW3_HORWE|nr:hypothetical protein D0867_01560 [Hortaea werneckii]RMY36879.1 hypothetical protein D0866_03637 [Hortaea werneckii]
MVPQRLRLLLLALLHLHVASSVPTNSTYTVPTNSTYTVPSLQNSTVTSTGTSTGLGDYIIAGLEHATSTSAGSQTENDRSDVASTSLTLSASSTSTNDGLTESKSPGNHTSGVLTGSMKMSASPSPSASTSLTLSAGGTSTNERLIESKFSGNHTFGVLTGSVRSTASPSPSGDQNITADAYACNSARASWSSYSSNPRNLSTTSYTYTTTSYNASVGTADIYTTSDGIPVARGNLTSTGQTWYTTSISKEVYPTDKVEITGSSPTCTVPAHICTSWYESYMDALGLTLFEDVIPTRTAVPASILTMSPHCPQPMVRLDEHGNGVSTVGPSCSFWGGHVSVYYWNTWDTPTPSAGFAPATTNASLPRVTTVGNITMTYPSVYLSLDQLTAWTEAVVFSYSTTSVATVSGYQRQIGDAYHNILISMDPADVSSLRNVPLDYSAFVSSITASGIYNRDLLSKSQTPDLSYIGWIGTPRAMDYEHITAPSPEDYFLNPNMPPNCKWNSRNDMCGTIYEGDYRPQLSLPSQLIDLDPAWKNCEPYIQGIYDPPKALQPATTLDGPEFASSLPTTTSAKQASSVVAPTPTPTSSISKSDPTTAIDASSPDGTSAQGQPTSQVKPTAKTSGPDEPNTPSTVKETRGPAPSSDGGPASDETSAQRQSTSQVKPTTNTSGLDGPETPSTIKETGGLAPSSNGGESGQDSEAPVTSTPSAIDEASPITTDAPISTPDETFPTSPGTTADEEPSSSPTVDSPTTSPATDPSTSPSQNLAETSPEAAPSFANEAPSTATENALSVLSAAQATYTSQGPAVAEVPESTFAANTVLTRTTVRTSATEAGQGNIPSIGETRTFPIEVAGSTFTATHLVDSTGATQVQIAETTLSVGGSPASIGDGNQVSAASDGLVIVGGGADEQHTSTLLFPTSAHMSVGSTAQGGVEGSTVSAGQVLGTGSAVGGAYTLSNGRSVISAGGQGLISVSDGVGVSGQDATSTVPPGVVATEASRSSQSGDIFVVSAAGATFTASSLEEGVVGVGGDDVLTSGGPDLVRDSATLSLGSAGIVVAGVEETSTVQLPKAEPSTTGPGGILVPLDSQTLTALPTGSNGVILGEGTTLSAGGPAVTVGQQSLSLDSAGILVYGPDGTTTVPTPQSPTLNSDTSTFLLTVGGQIIPASRVNPTAIALPDIQTTLHVGGEAATIADETITLETSALILASGSKTSTLPFHSKPNPSSHLVPVAVLTAARTKYTVFSPSPSEETTAAAAAVIIDNQTLSPGGRPITLPNGAGTLRLLPSNTGIEVLDASRTTTLPLATPAW